MVVSRLVVRRSCTSRGRVFDSFFPFFGRIGSCQISLRTFQHEIAWDAKKLCRMLRASAKKQVTRKRMTGDIGCSVTVSEAERTSSSQSFMTGQASLSYLKVPRQHRNDYLTSLLRSQLSESGCSGSAAAVLSPHKASSDDAAARSRGFLLTGSFVALPKMRLSYVTLARAGSPTRKETWSPKRTQGQ